jgi:hypothetical protein
MGDARSDVTRRVWKSEGQETPPKRRSAADFAARWMSFPPGFAGTRPIPIARRRASAVERKKERKNPAPTGQRGRSMKAMGLVVARKGYWREIAGTLIDLSLRGLWCLPSKTEKARADSLVATRGTTENRGRLARKAKTRCQKFDTTFAGRKGIQNVASTSTGEPLFVAGWNCHLAMASLANWSRRSSTLRSTRTLPTVPSAWMMA